MGRVFEYLYLLVALAELVAEFGGNGLLRFMSKPLLMIMLIVFYVQSNSGEWNSRQRMMIAALVFSWFGDVALMLVYRNENFFLVGLIGFLITHILYILCFNKVTYKTKGKLLSYKPYVVLPLVLYMICLLYLLVPAIRNDENNRSILIPVLVYSTAIAAMVLFSINRYERVNYRSFVLVLSGALLFMISDSIIAINKFLHPFAAAGTFIMSLYIAGQYLIVKGMLSQDKMR